MDDNTGTRKKPRAISARPVSRPAAGATSPAQVATAPAQHPRAESMQVIEGGGAKPGPNVKFYIERQLKSVYDDVLNQPIPDRFLDLLNSLNDKAAPESAPGAASNKKEGRE